MHELTDEQWLDIVLGSSQLPDFIGKKLFGIPEDQLMISTVGRAGDVVFRSAFEFYSLLKRMLLKHGNGIDARTSILDFGCGWGRIIRFLRKDFDPSLTFGVDVQASVLSAAMRDVPDCIFSRIGTHPPVHFKDSQFDLIYAYSVFSHLPESMIQLWVSEFARILKPGGILCVTTRPRAHIQAVHSKTHPDKTAHTSMYAGIITDPDGALARYDAGEIVHYPAGAGDLATSQWGETMISPAFARSKLSKDLEFIDFLEGYSTHYLQPALIMRKHAKRIWWKLG